MNFRQDRCQLADSNRESLSGGSSYHRQGCLMFSLVIFTFSKPRASHPGQCQSYTVKCLLINSIFYLNICLLFLLVFIIVFILITIWHLLYDQYLLHYLFNFHAISHIVQTRKLERLSKTSSHTASKQQNSNTGMSNSKAIAQTTNLFIFTQQMVSFI